MAQDKTKDALERLEKGIQELYNSGKYMNFLKTMSKFHNYSYGNSMLIYLQKPDSTYVAGFNSWKNNFKRHVLKGQKGIQILAPATFKQKIEMEKIDTQTQKPVIGESGKPVTEVVEIEKPYFRPVYVFDVSQTDGEPIPELAPELKTDVANFDTFYKSLEKISPFPIEKEVINSGAKGYCDYLNERIAIKEGLSEAQTIKTGIHEIAHAILHSDIKNPERKDNHTREVEAESVAFIVADHFGVDTSTYSFGYIATWSANKELTELKSSLSTIQKTANSLINDVEAAYKEIQLAKDLALATSLRDGEIDLDQVKTRIVHEDMPKEIDRLDTLDTTYDHTKAPVVTIEWSENPAFRSGEKMSIHEANSKFQAIDNSILELKKEAVAQGDYHPYDKTRFEINCIYEGQEFTYAGRQDLGDGDGSLIKHIELFVDQEYPGADMEESYQNQARKGFSSYLSQHDLLEQMKDVSSVEVARMSMIVHSNASQELKLEAYQHLNYNHAILDYVDKSQNDLNYGISINEAPDRANYIQNAIPDRNEVVQDSGTKSSIKERMEAAKERSATQKNDFKQQEKEKSKAELVR